MAFALECDACEYDEEVERERDAYQAAKAHERDHPKHFVYITKIL